jgi:hypothetical protein
MRAFLSLAISGESGGIVFLLSLGFEVNYPDLSGGKPWIMSLPPEYHPLGCGCEKGFQLNNN